MSCSRNRWTVTVWPTDLGWNSPNASLYPDLRSDEECSHSPFSLSLICTLLADRRPIHPLEAHVLMCLELGDVPCVAERMQSLLSTRVVAGVARGMNEPEVDIKHSNP